MIDQTSILDLNFDDLCQALRNSGTKTHHAKALWAGIHRHGLQDLSNTEFSPPLRAWVNANIGPGKPFHLPSIQVEDEIFSGDGLTRKYLLKLADGQVIETVLMEYQGRFTACLSSQAGCAMGCVFCATGQMGLARHLTVGEIVAQVIHVRRILHITHPQRRLRNIVLMGMGEPLHNYNSVIKALGIISDRRGANVGPTRISISTVGLVPAILKLAEAKLPYRLAVSLHGSTQEERAALVPMSKKWNLETLLEACRTYCEKTAQHIFFEWTLIAGKNDSEETAHRLVALLSEIPCHLNIIPLNPTHGFSGAPSAQGLKFQEIIRTAGIPCTFRQRRGIDVAAGCGMLKAQRRQKQPADLQTSST